MVWLTVGKKSDSVAGNCYRVGWATWMLILQLETVHGGRATEIGIALVGHFVGGRGLVRVPDRGVAASFGAGGFPDEVGPARRV